MKPYAQRGELNLYRAKLYKQRKTLKPELGITIDFIQNQISDYFNIPLEVMQSKSQKREAVQARQIAMFFSKNRTNKSLRDIGEKIGGRDHSTVSHACKTVNNLMDTDKLFKMQIDEIYNILNHDTSTK